MDPGQNRKDRTMTKSELFKAAHKIARETKSIAGSYRVAFACALKDLYAVEKATSEKTPAEKAWEHFEEGNTVYTRRDGLQMIYLYATELLSDCSKAESRSKVILTKNAEGVISAQMDGFTNASQRARLARALSAFAA